ncbi:MFS transporter, partial [Priestia megaterium]
SPILVGYLLQSYDMTVAMTYLAGLYCISFIFMVSLKRTGEKKVKQMNAQSAL